MKIYFCLEAIEFKCNFVFRPSKVQKIVRTNQFQVKSTKMGTRQKFVLYSTLLVFFCKIVCGQTPHHRVKQNKVVAFPAV